MRALKSSLLGDSSSSAGKRPNKRVQVTESPDVEKTLLAFHKDLKKLFFTGSRSIETLLGGAEQIMCIKRRLISLIREDKNICCHRASDLLVPTEPRCFHFYFHVLTCRRKDFKDFGCLSKNCTVSLGEFY